VSELCFGSKTDKIFHRVNSREWGRPLTLLVNLSVYNLQLGGTEGVWDAQSESCVLTPPFAMFLVYFVTIDRSLYLSEPQCLFVFFCFLFLRQDLCM
jgi:hypothetical protein